MTGLTPVACQVLESGLSILFNIELYVQKGSGDHNKRKETSSQLYPSAGQY